MAQAAPGLPGSRLMIERGRPPGPAGHHHEEKQNSENSGDT